VTLGTAAMWLLAFWITLAERELATRCTQAIRDRQPVVGANYSALFELVLCIDVWFLVTDYWLGIPIVVGAWIGGYHSIKREKTF
jgi:hypothetical protein